MVLDKAEHVLAKLRAGDPVTLDPTAVEHQPVDGLRTARRPMDCQGSRQRGAEQVGPLQAQHVEERVEHLHLQLDQVFLRSGVGQAAARSVVPDQGPSSGQGLVEAPLDGQRPPELHMGNPTGQVHQRRAAPGDGIADRGSVAQTQPVDPLLHDDHCAASCG